jgi:hypothetical protein
VGFHPDLNYFTPIVFNDLYFIVMDDPNIETLLVTVRRRLKRLALGRVLRDLLTLDQNTVVPVPLGGVLNLLPYSDLDSV